MASDRGTSWAWDGALTSFSSRDSASVTYCTATDSIINKAVNIGSVEARHPKKNEKSMKMAAVTCRHQYETQESAGMVTLLMTEIGVASVVILAVVAAAALSSCRGCSRSCGRRHSRRRSSVSR